MMVHIIIAEILAFRKKQYGATQEILKTQLKKNVIQLGSSKKKMSSLTCADMVMRRSKEKKIKVMLVARVKQSVAKLVNLGTHRHHMLIRIQAKNMEQKETTSVEILVVSKTQYGVIQLIHSHLGKNVSQLVYLFSKILMTLPVWLRRGCLIEGIETELKTSVKEESMLKSLKSAQLV